MRPERTTGPDYIRSHCASSDRILLINPPVIETRYQWLRWNQPLDLLKLGSLLKEEIGCDVKLYDFMLPKNGRVTRTTNHPNTEVKFNDYSYPLWRYGELHDNFVKWLHRTMVDWRPTQVWVTSLTSYWWKSIRSLIGTIRSKLEDTKVVLYGQYPRLEIEHAEQHSFAHTIITDSIDIVDCHADFGLYVTKDKPSFCALDVNSKNWIAEVLDKFKSGINDFAFFSEQILEPQSLLLPRLKELHKQISNKSASRRPKFYGIMGLYPASFTEEAALQMRESGFVEFHFEHQSKGEELDLDAYRLTKQACHKAGLNSGGLQTSAFLFIGLPNDDLERIIRQMMNLLEVFGSVILKPYTPTPGSSTYSRYKEHLVIKPIEHLSPHLFPFSEINNISHRDYEELYTLAAVLNEKVRGRAFNNFPGSLSYEMIKTSLGREVWKLGIEESPAN